MEDKIFPSASVIIPVYNGKKTIGACIDSLLAQDYPRDRYEIIVVDNGSSDGTREVVSRCQVSGVRCQAESGTWNLEPRTSNLRYIYEPIRGSYKARNTGIREAKGEILAFTDADCIADKEWLKKGVEGFIDNNIGCVAGAIRAYEAKTFVERYLTDMQMLSQKDSGDFFGFLPFAQTANGLYRSDVFGRIGYFEEKWVSGGDADFCWRMQLKTGYKLSFIDTAVVYHKHRSTVRGMFGQVVKNGEGNVLLYKKYPVNLKKTTLKQAIWILYRLICVSLRLAFLSLRKIEAMDSAFQKRYLDSVTFLARELGRIKGSFKNRVFYI